MNEISHLSPLELTRRTLFALIAIALAGCQSSPRNGLELPNATSVVNFTGFVPTSGTAVQLQARNQTVSNTWVTLSTVTSETNLITDQIGQKWSPYGGNVTLPFGRNATALWKGASSVSGQRRISIETRSYGGGGLAALNTFDVSDDACLQANESKGGLQLALICNSDAEYSASLFLNCGKKGQACCLANALPAASSCDTGSLCDQNTNLCTLPVGGINQPCIFGGQGCTASAPSGHKLACLADPAAPWPATGMCRDVSIERAPVLTSEIVLHTCDTTNANSTTSKFVALTSNYSYGTSYYNKNIPMHHVFWLDKAGEDLQRNATETYGLRLDSVSTLGDINQLVVGIDGDRANDGWCFDRVALNVNGQQVFSKSIPGGITLDSDSSKYVTVVATSAELRLAFAALNRAPLCGLPTSLGYTQLSRQAEGIMGDMITRTELGDEGAVQNAHKFKLWWGAGGVTVTRANAGAAKIHMQFRMEDKGSGFQATAKVDLLSQMSCDWSLDEGQSIPGVPFPPILECSTDFQSPMVLSAVNVDADTILPGVQQIVEAFARNAIVNGMIDALDSFVGFQSFFDDAEATACKKLSTSAAPICDVGGEICGCPAITFSNSAIQMSWANFGVYGFNLSAPPVPPDPLCLR